MSRWLPIVGLECVATSLKASGRTSHQASIRRQHRERTRAHRDGHPTVALPHARDSSADGAKAVGFAFARVMAERYPGTSWLPLKPGRRDDGLVLSAGKVVRLISGPADVDAGDGIGCPAAPTANGRASHEDGADTCAQ